MNIVITGASSGVGETLTERFASQDHTVYALARSENKLKELEEKHPGHVRAYPVDVSLADQVNAVFDAIIEQQQQIDVLINNAAVFNRCEFEKEDLSTIDRLIDTNLKGTMYATLKVLPAMVERGRGAIVNIASVAGTNAIPAQAVYGASKHGVVGFSEVVAQEVKDKGVLVTAVCPGGIDTPLWNENNPYFGDEEKLISTDEIADLVEFVLDRPKTTLYKKIVFFPTNDWHHG